MYTERAAAIKIQRFFRKIDAFSHQKGKDESSDDEADESSVFPNQVRRDQMIRERADKIVSELEQTPRDLPIILRNVMTVLSAGVALDSKGFRYFLEMSEKNIMTLKKMIPKMSEKDIEFALKFCKLSFDFTHFTRAKLDPEFPCVLSLKNLLCPNQTALHQKWAKEGKFGIGAIANAGDQDINDIRDTGFVFFHMLPRGFDKTNITSAFGTDYYSLSIDYREMLSRGVEITLNDLAGSHKTEFKVFLKTFIEPQLVLQKFDQDLCPKVKAYFNRTLTKILDSLVQHEGATLLFVGGNSLLAISYSILYLRNALLAELKRLEPYRPASISDDDIPDMDDPTLVVDCEANPDEPVCFQPSEEQRQLLEDGVFYDLLEAVIADVNGFLDSDLQQDPAKLNALLNGWIRPIAKIPGAVMFSASAEAKK